MTAPAPPPERSYGCTFGCGNPFDYVLTTVADGSTEFLCLPCFIRLASDMLAAATQPDNPTIMEALAMVRDQVGDQVPGPSGKPRGRNAPATTDDPGLFGAYDAVVTVDDLPEAFR